MQAQAKNPVALIRSGPLVLGAVFFAGLLITPAPAGMTAAAWDTVAVAALMATLWASEAIPIPATSLLPVILLPLLGISTTRDASLPYASPVIFLLLGGFLAAMGMQRTGLHRRIALFIVSRAGDRPGALIGGFMAACALLSMWISNTATTLMIVPIALTVAGTVLKDTAGPHPFTLALLIGCAWSASIGGLGTYIGTPPNLFVKAFIEQSTGYEIRFLEWMAFAVPVVLVLVPTAWWVLTRISFRFNADTLSGGSAAVAEARAQLGPITAAERRVALILGTMSFFWVTRQFIADIDALTAVMPWVGRLSDTHIAVAGGLAMFIVPAREAGRGALLSWDEAVQLPWGVILLFGGGLSLAAAIQASGLSLWLGEAMSGLSNAPLFLSVFLIVLLVIFLTELTSNTATTAALVPVMSALAAVADLNPLILAAPVAMAASCAFMLPVATGPNAVVFATGQIRVRDMMRAGLYLNLLASLVVASLCYLLVPRIFGLT